MGDIIGYLYRMGIHFVLGYANADGVKQIWAGDTCLWPSLGRPGIEAEDAVSNDESLYINAVACFGGHDAGGEGGIEGDVDIQYGASTQSPNSYLVSKLGSDISAYRGLLSVILKNCYLGTSPYIKPWSFFIKRTDKLVSGGTQWYPSKAVIRSGEIDGDDLNAIHIIRECLTDKEWGLGWDESSLNDYIFKDCADTLYDEGYGLSIIWDAESSLEDFIDRILEVIAGTLYQNLSTGLWEIGLVRDDYTPALLDSYNESQILSVEDFYIPTYGETVNQVVVNWHDKVYNRNRSITISDQVMIEHQDGATIPRSFNYYCICNNTLANKVASRELQLVTSMLATMTLKCNRQMSHLKPNDVFKFSWSPLDISDMIVRVLEVNYGSLKSNEITIKCCEDVFAVANPLVQPPPDTKWTDPRVDPDDVTHAFIIEAPYWQLCESLHQDIVDVLDDDSSRILCLIPRPTVAGGYRYYKAYWRLQLTDDYSNAGDYVFIPTATLVNDLEIFNSESDWVDLENVKDLDLIQENDYALIGDDVDHEIVLILEVDSDNERIKISRGVFDTVPRAHSSGDRLWLVGPERQRGLVSLIDETFTQGDIVRVKARTVTRIGILGEDAATEFVGETCDSRMIRPYPPGNFKINGDRFPEYLYGQPTLTWNHRDRTDKDQVNYIVKHTDSSDYGPESGTTYTLKIYNQDDYLLRTETGLTGTSYTYSQVTEEGDSPDGHVSHKLRFVLYSVRSGYDSYQEYDITVERPLFGTIDASSTVSGSILVNPRKMKGTTDGVVTTIGDCFEISLLAGTADGVATTSGNLTGEQELAGTADGVATTSGDVTEV